MNAFLLTAFTAMTFFILQKNQMALSLAQEALNLWFQKMIPALLPFMILSGLLINMDLSDRFASFFSVLLRPVYRLSDSCLYCMIIGFLCGFPMGARVCAQSLEKKKISHKEASLMLAFCNNIGPVYFTGFVLRLFPTEHLFGALFGMYGIPLFYGLFLRYTVFKEIPFHKAVVNDPSGKNVFFLPELNRAIQSALDSITVLGGYMIFCNMLNLIPNILFAAHSHLLTVIGPILEITSGLSRISVQQKELAFILLPFGGISCIAQTASCIKNTDLSLSEYIFHKLIQTILTTAYYGFFSI